MTSRIGRFEILDTLGDTVAGHRFRAYDPATNRDVALETFRLSMFPGDAASDAFVQGLKRSAQLSHPNIAATFDVGVDNDVAYVVRELIAGAPLDRAMLEYGPFGLAEIAPVLRQIGSALDCAHGQGVTHGDLEPSRILLLENGDVRITGFGTDLQGIRMPQGAHAFAGDPRYFSPEKVRGEERTHRSDIFSFGVIVYELLSGRTPFESDSLIAALYRVVNEPHRPISEIRPELPAGIDEVLDYALAKQPKDRYLSCASFIDSIDALLPEEEEQPEPLSAEEHAEPARDVRFCDQCGEALQAKMKFCWSCGATVAHAIPEATAEPAEPVLVATAEPAPDRKAEAAAAPTPILEPPPEPEAGPEPVHEPPAPPARPVQIMPAVVVEAGEPVEPIPAVAEAPAPQPASPATTSRMPAAGARPTVPVVPVRVAQLEVPEPVAAPAPARTEVAPVPGRLAPPLAGYARSTGTLELPAPGIPIDLTPKKRSPLTTIVIIGTLVGLLALFLFLGFWLAPRLLTPSAPPPAATPAEPAAPASESAAEPSPSV